MVTRWYHGGGEKENLEILGRRIPSSLAAGAWDDIAGEGFEVRGMCVWGGGDGARRLEDAWAYGLVCCLLFRCCTPSLTIRSVHVDFCRRAVC